MANDRLIFIAGSMRSGTTILHKILCTATETHPYITETWFLVDQLHAYLRGRERYDVRHRDYFGEIENFDRFYRDTLERFFEVTRKNLSDPQVLVLKNPEISGQLPLLGGWFKDALFIINVRNPLDIIASIVEVGERHRKDGIRSEQSLMGRDMYMLSNFVKRYYISSFDVNNPVHDRILFVRYEDMMSDVKKECERIGSFCGLTFPTGKLHALGDENAGSANMDPEIRLQDPFSGAFWSELYNKNLSTQRIGRHTEVLTAGEIDKVKKYCADFNQVYKYW